MADEVRLEPKRPLTVRQAEAIREAFRETWPAMARPCAGDLRPRVCVEWGVKEFGRAGLYHFDKFVGPVPTWAGPYVTGRALVDVMSAFERKGAPLTEDEMGEVLALYAAPRRVQPETEEASMAMREVEAPVRGGIAGAGIPQKDPVLKRVYDKLEQANNRLGVVVDQLYQFEERLSGHGEAGSSGAADAQERRGGTLGGIEDLVDDLLDKIDRADEVRGRLARIG